MCFRLGGKTLKKYADEIGVVRAQHGNAISNRTHIISIANFTDANRCLFVEY